MKKCIVLDLDNTLWGGVVGEDGIDGIKLSLTSPGNSFIAFQQALLDAQQRGVILALNSRNNEEDALHVIRTHPNMILKEHHFAARRINWNDKAENLKELSNELNIGLDSIVFFDDDKTNRELVKTLLPEVTVPELPENPKEYTKFFNSLSYFDTQIITDEDKMRGNLYVTERLRREEEKTHVSKEDFLKSLNLELFIYKDDQSCLPRLSQLTEKTNQFNTDKKPLSESEIESYMRSDKHTIYHARLQDTFGDYGVILFAHIEKGHDSWSIKSFLMSCRIFGRNIEEAFFAFLLGEAFKERISTITIAYKESEKNVPARDFITSHFTNFSREVKDGIKSPEWVTLRNV